MNTIQREAVVIATAFLSIAVPGANAQDSSLPVTKITVIDKDENAFTIYNDNDVDRIEVGTRQREITIERVTDKSSWRVLYGSIAMPWYREYETTRNGNYASAMDNIVDDNAGWMSHVNIGYNRYQDLGNPYMVIDLGAYYPVARLGVRVGDGDGSSFDVMPKHVEIYYTDKDPSFPFSDNPDYLIDKDRDIYVRNDGNIYHYDHKYTDEELATNKNHYTEWDLLNARNIRGLSEEGELVPEYLDLARRIRQHDETINWRKLVDISIKDRDPIDGNSYMSYIQEENVDYNEVPRIRYIKLELTPFAKGEGSFTPVDPVIPEDRSTFDWLYVGDRTKINEVRLGRLVAIDGIPVPFEPATADFLDAVNGDRYDYESHTDENGRFLPESPYNHQYNRSMMMKFMMATPSTDGNSSIVRMTYAEALENIRKIDNITQGIDKIIYLVGVTNNGFDNGYPTLSVLNEALKRPEDANARESLRWLQEEARKYHTTVSVHLVFNDAYRNSTDWNTYLRNDLLCRDTDGSLSEFPPLQGQKRYRVNLVKEWEKGYLQQRIKDVTALCNLTEVGTVHVDAFFPPVSPYHGVTKEDSERVMRQVIRYWRDLGVDVTGEFYSNASGGEDQSRIDPMFGLQAAAWWNDLPFEARCQKGFTPALAWGGMSGWCGTYYDDAGFLLGDNMHGEETLAIADENQRWEQFKHDFCTTTLPAMLLGDLEVESYSLHQDGKSTVRYNHEVSCEFDDNTRIGKIWYENGRVVARDGNDLFFMMTWGEGSPILYSEKGYDNRTWPLAAHLSGHTAFKVYDVTPDGLQEREGRLEVSDGAVTLSMQPREMLLLRPVNE